MEWMTVKEAAECWGISNRRATILCANGKVMGAQKLDVFWVVPKGTQKPVDGRTKAAKEKKAERKFSRHPPKPLTEI